MMFILDKAAKDPGFNQRMKSQPDETLTAYDLTPDEALALKSGHPDLLRETGLDERIAQWVPWRVDQDEIPEFAEPPFSAMKPWVEPPSFAPAPKPHERPTIVD